MSAFTAVLALAAVAFWLFAIVRDGAIGIGCRFLYAVNLVAFFLVGPLLSAFANRPLAAGMTWYKLDRAVDLAAGGLIAYVAGAYFVFPALLAGPMIPPRFWSVMSQPARVRHTERLAWWLIAIGLVSLLGNPVLGSVPTLRAIWSHVNLLFESGLLMLCLRAALTKRWGRVATLFALLAAMGILKAALTGHFGFTMITGLLLLAIVFIGIRFTWSSFGAFVGVGVLLFIPYMMWINGRDYVRGAISQGAGLQERVSVTIDVFTSADRIATNSTDQVAEQYSLRGDYSLLLAAAIDHTPTHEPYAAGRTVWESVFAVVPRVLWPNKPFQMGGNTFVTRYTGIPFSENVSVAMNYLFELYVNFGHAGTYIGMLIIGLSMGWIERLFYRHALERPWIEWSIILAMWAIGMSCDRFAQVAMTVPPAIVMSWFVGKGLEALFGALRSRRATTGPSGTPGNGRPRRESPAARVPRNLSAEPRNE